MYQREALWLAFNSDRQALPTALKVSVGGINAITGLPKGKEDVDMQDYLCDQQPWLDGVATQPGVVKQFVAVDVNEGYTVEEQVTGRVSMIGSSTRLLFQTVLIIFSFMRRAELAGDTTDRCFPELPPRFHMSSSRFRWPIVSS